jgi:hypothetical protein
VAISRPGGVISVVDLSSPAGLSLNDLTVTSNAGDHSTAVVYMNATAASFTLLSITGQGNTGPFGAVGTETLVATLGYYDTGPWSDGESFGLLAGTSPSRPIAPSATLASPYIWNAIAVLVD